jgi:hypothetical protein
MEPLALIVQRVRGLRLPVSHHLLGVNRVLPVRIQASPGPGQRLSASSVLKDSGHRLLQQLLLVPALIVLEELGRVYLVHLHLLLVYLAIQVNGLRLFRPHPFPAVSIVARGPGLLIMQQRQFLHVLIVFLEHGLELWGHPQ